MRKYKMISISIIIMLILLIGWSILRSYGGEKVSVGIMEFYYISREYNEGDEALFYIINDNTPIEIYATNKDNCNKAIDNLQFAYLKNQHYIIAPYDKKEIRFTALEDDEYGLIITSRTDERAEFKFQVREPMTSGHVRYSIVVFYILLFFLVLLIFFAFIISISNRSYNDDFDDLIENDVLDEDISLCPYCKGPLLWHDYSQRYYCSHCQMFV